MNGWIIVALLQPIRFLTFFALFLSQGDWLQEQVTSNNCHRFPIVDTISLPFSFQAWWWMHWFFVVIQILVCSFLKIFFWISQWCISRYQCLFSKQWRKGGEGIVSRRSVFITFHNKIVLLWRSLFISISDWIVWRSLFIKISARGKLERRQTFFSL